VTRTLADPWQLGSLCVPNRVMLAPLAGIGNWFVRLQAKRFGAGMAVSEMVSSHAIHYGNRKTCTEMLRIDPREREPTPPTPPALGGVGGPVSIQLFGEDPAIMRSAAAQVVAAGAALLEDPERAVAVARAAVQGAREGARARTDANTATQLGDGQVGATEPPVTVKLRSGLRPGEESGFELAHRLVADAGVAAIGFHPRSAAVHHKGVPDYQLAARLVASLPAPVILTGGMDDADGVREALASTGAAAVMLARGALGNPWLFSELLDGRTREPTRAQVLAELRWTIARAIEHLGEQRATRYLRKFYPWYVPRLRLDASAAKNLQEALQSAPTLACVHELLELACRPAALAV